MYWNSLRNHTHTHMYIEERQVHFMRIVRQHTKTSKGGEGEEEGRRVLAYSVNELNATVCRESVECWMWNAESGTTRHGTRQTAQLPSTQANIEQINKHGQDKGHAASTIRLGSIASLDNWQWEPRKCKHWDPVTSWLGDKPNPVTSWLRYNLTERLSA